MDLLHVHNFAILHWPFAKYWFTGLFKSSKNGHMHYKIFFLKKIRLVKITVGLSEMFLSTGRSSHSSWQLQVFHILFWLKSQKLSSAMDTIISFSRSLGLTRFTFEKMSAKYQLSLLLSQPQGAFLWNNHQTSGCSRSTCCIPPTCHIEY